MTAYAVAGGRLEVSRVVEAPADAAWELLTDTTRWPEWGPSVRAVDCPDRRIRPGSTGRVRTPLGRVRFRVTECTPYRWSWRVAGIPATGHRVDAGEATVVVFEVPLVAAGYAPVCAFALRRIEALLR